MAHIRFDCTHAKGFFDEDEFKLKESEVYTIHQQLHNRNTDVDGVKGWVHLPLAYETKEFDKIKQTAKKIQQESDVLLVIGVGGSYLGARAAIEMLQHNFHELLYNEERRAPHIIFAGHNMSSSYLSQIKDILKYRDFSINVISKSGTTTEPAIAYRIFKDTLVEKYGRKEARNRTYITTNLETGALRKLAEEEANETFVIPDDIGGRYSVLTAVGLLPMAVSGIHIGQVLQGAYRAFEELMDPSMENIAYQYSMIRYLLHKEGKTVELLVNYEPNMQSFSKWWQQLFAESEGKNKQGILPVYATFPTDLHSIGQYIQDGRKDLFETIIQVEQSTSDIRVPYQEDNIDELNYLAGETVHSILDNISTGATLAHVDGNIPNMSIYVPKFDAYTFGYLVYFFQKACAMSGYLHNVNPFDQPGVEAYKQNMFALLGKPGFEQQKEMLDKRIKQLTNQFDVTLSK